MSEIYIAEAKGAHSERLPVCYEVSSVADPTVLIESDVLSSVRDVIDSMPILPSERRMVDASYDSRGETVYWVNQHGVISDLDGDGRLKPRVFAAELLNGGEVPDDVAKALGNYAAHDFFMAVELTHTDDNHPQLTSLHQHFQAFIKDEAGQAKPIVTILDKGYLEESYGSENAVMRGDHLRRFQMTLPDLITLQPSSYSV